jgi:hypothetical protein
MRKLSTCLVVTLLAGALLAACGGKSSTSSQTGTTSGTSTEGSSAGGSSTSGSGTGASTTSGSTTSHSTNGSAGKASSGSGGSLAEPAKAATAQEIETCKHNVAGLQGVPAETKKTLEAHCATATTVKAQRKIVHEACEALAKRLPNGVSKERALEVCRLGP